MKDQDNSRSLRLVALLAFAFVLFLKSQKMSSLILFGNAASMRAHQIDTAACPFGVQPIFV